MRFFRTLPRSETLEGLLHRAALVALLTLAPIVAAAFSRLDVLSPTVERSTAVAAEQSGSGPLPGPVANPSPPGSATPPSPSPSSSPLIPLGTLAEIYPELDSLTAATAFTIIEDRGGAIWLRTGHGGTSVTAQCTLTRTQTDYAGTCFGRARVERILRASDPLALERQYELPVNVPTDAGDRFLRELATMPLADGPYKPIPTPDVFFHREFRILSDAGTVRVFSDTWPGPALGPGGAPRPRPPWAVEYGGRQMVTDAAAPSQAYEAIRPYLDEFRKLANLTLDQLYSLIQAPEPSPSPRAGARPAPIQVP